MTDVKRADVFNATSPVASSLGIFCVRVNIRRVFPFPERTLNEFGLDDGTFKALIDICDCFLGILHRQRRRINQLEERVDIFG